VGGGAAPVDPIVAIDDILGDEARRTGMQSLSKVNIFNIVCLPADPTVTWGAADLAKAVSFCADHRAMLIVDPPTTWTASGNPVQFDTVNSNPAVSSALPNAAVYYPNLVLAGAGGESFQVGPSGAVAGVWAATDATRGVWKAPAGLTACLIGVRPRLRPPPPASR